MNYKTKWTEVRVGQRSFKIMQLQNFEEAVDQIIEILHARGEKNILPEQCPYFGQLWAAALDLAAWMDVSEIASASNEEFNVLEIGCGLALPSLVCLAKGAKVDSFDLHEDVGGFITKNLEANKNYIKSENFRYHCSSWENFRPSNAVYDLIIGSDILYENQHPNQIIDFFKKHSKKTTIIRITDPCRWHHQDFIKLLDSSGFSTKFEYHWIHEEGDPKRPIKMCRIEARVKA